MALRAYASQSLFAGQQHIYHSPSYRTGQQAKKCVSSTLILFFIILLVSAYIRLTDISAIRSSSTLNSFSNTNKPVLPLLSCPDKGRNQTCENDRYPVPFQPSNTTPGTCPEYFRWIHEDLKPWKVTGITREMVERAKEDAFFRVVILKGKVYVEKYKECYETRDVFTIWGILQLLRLYPDRVPDLELMMLACEDRPVILRKDFQGRNSSSVPPLFHYCGSDDTFSIVFPDWTFWGWGELNIRPWNNLLEDIKEGNKRTKWKDRKPYAYWKGNHYVSDDRYQFMKQCNLSAKTRMLKQDWNAESRKGYKNSKLEDQCTYRYKIYIEGWAWSVSEKYILACNSMVLLVKPEFFDFFTRSLVPLQHYWHISSTNKCRDVEFAVDWGNNHTDRAQAIGEAGSRFIQENVKMEYVYDYMLHLLTEYAKLLKYKPTLPEGAKEVCSETMVCSQKGVRKKFMVESMVKSPSDRLPCSMANPYEPQELEAFVHKIQSISRQIEMLQTENLEKVS